MWAFMTTGTPKFLKNFIAKHTGQRFHFMKSTSSGLLYYEDKRKKGLFVSGRTSEIRFTTGTIDQKGFVVMNNIPVMEEEMAVFEDRIKQQLQHLANSTKTKAIRLLKEVGSNKYIVFTQWNNERDYNEWQKENENSDLDFTTNTRLPAYFADRPFTNTYYMIHDDEE